MKNKPKLLKAELHAHSKEDKRDNISYTAKQLINLAAKQGFDVLSLTFHNNFYYPKSLVKYAKRKNILLIPGCEQNIEGRHVLIYNIDEKERKKLKTFDDLRKLKGKKDILVTAPHPYYVYHLSKISLFEKLEKNIDVFDAIEWSYFYKFVYNPNRKAKRIAEKYHKALVGGTDVHELHRLNYTFTLVDSKRNINSVISAIKRGKVVLITTPPPLKKFIKTTVYNLTK